MFTGIIQKTAKVVSIQSKNQGTTELKITQPFAKTDPIELGESIANNGVCLTVTEVTDQDISFDLGPETLEISALKRLKIGSIVNLERSLRMGDRLSGHWVQGHVDGVAQVSYLEQVSDGCYDLRVQLKESKLIKYCVKKGSIAIDGISLTIHAIEKDHLSFQIIPHTWHHTALADLKVGDTVNIEVDILAKYAENFAHLHT